MNQETEQLLREVATRLERAIYARDCPAIVALHGNRTLFLSDYDYLRDDATAAAFELRAAQTARGIDTTRFVFAVPQVWLATDDGVAARAVANLPLREGEEEVIAWLSLDITDGADYGCVPYTRRPNGEPIFDEPRIMTVPIQPSDVTPGWRLLRALVQEGSESADN